MQAVKSLFQKWWKLSLIIRIVTGLVIGVILGITVPGLGILTLIGNIFVGALKAVAPILVFVLVMSALANAGGGIQKRFRTVIILYLLGTLLAAVTAVAASYIFPVGMVLTEAAEGTAPPSNISEVLMNLINNMVSNPVSALTNANYIGILFWAIVFGFGLRELASAQTRSMIDEIAQVVSQAVRWIINFAPFGILGLVYTAVSESGLEIFTVYGRLLLNLVGSMLFVALVVNPIIVALFLKRNPYPLVFRCIRESGVTAFFTRSSAANIPVNMKLCADLGLESDFYSVSIPLGATINMAGAAVTITTMTLAVCHTLGVHVDFPTAIVLSVISTLGACGASGVAGGSLLLIPLACSLFGISADIAMQAVSVGFIIGVIQDSVETAVNSSSDVLFTATAEFHDRLQQNKEVHF